MGLAAGVGFTDPAAGKGDGDAAPNWKGPAPLVPPAVLLPNDDGFPKGLVPWPVLPAGDGPPNRLAAPPAPRAG